MIVHGLIHNLFADYATHVAHTDMFPDSQESWYVETKTGKTSSYPLGLVYIYYFRARECREEGNLPSVFLSEFLAPWKGKNSVLKALSYH